MTCAIGDIAQILYIGFFLVLNIVYLMPEDG